MNWRKWKTMLAFTLSASALVTEERQQSPGGRAGYRMHECWLGFKSWFWNVPAIWPWNHYLPQRPANHFCEGPASDIYDTAHQITSVATNHLYHMGCDNRAPRLGAFISHSSGGWGSEIKMSAGLVFPEVSLSWQMPLSFSKSSHCLPCLCPNLLIFFFGGGGCAELHLST
jgi:hypothetical protein